jgi:hypothetical protein
MMSACQIWSRDLLAGLAAGAAPMSGHISAGRKRPGVDTADPIAVIVAWGDEIKIEGIIVPGHGTARMTISRHKFLVGEFFPDIEKCHDGTINLQLSNPLHVRLRTL